GLSTFGKCLTGKVSLNVSVIPGSLLFSFLNCLELVATLPTSSIQVTLLLSEVAFCLRLLSSLSSCVLLFVLSARLGGISLLLSFGHLFLSVLDGVLSVNNGVLVVQQGLLGII